MKSFGDYQSEFRQLLLSTRNDQNVNKGMPSISQANSTNDMIISKEQKGATSAPICADLVDEEEQVTSSPRSKLNPHAPAFVPSCKAMQILTQDRTLSDALKSSNLSATKVKLANRDILHTLVSHDMDTLNALDNNKKSLAITSKPSGIVSKRHELGALVQDLVQLKLLVVIRALTYLMRRMRIACWMNVLLMWLGMKVSHLGNKEEDTTK